MEYLTRIEIQTEWTYETTNEGDKQMKREELFLKAAANLPHALLYIDKKSGVMINRTFLVLLLRLRAAEKELDNNPEK